MKCEYFARCTHEATKMLKHPVLSLVPICDDCASRYMAWGGKADEFEPLLKAETTELKLAIAGDRHVKPKEYLFRQMTEEEIRNLCAGDHPWVLRNDGRAGTIKINGKVKTWKRDPSRVEVPFKYGMFEYGTWNLAEAKERLLIRIELE